MNVRWPLGRGTQLRGLVWNDIEDRPRILAGLALWWLLGITISGLLGAVVTGRSPLFELRGTLVGSIAVAAINLVVGAISTPVAIYLVGSVIEELLHWRFLLTNFAEGFQVGPVGARGAVAI